MEYNLVGSRDTKVGALSGHSVKFSLLYRQLRSYVEFGEIEEEPPVRLHTIEALEEPVEYRNEFFS